MYTLVTLRRLHDRRQSIRQVTDAIVAVPRKVPVPRNAVRRHSRALHQRPFHRRICQERIHDMPGVMAIRRSHIPPIAGPGVHLNFSEARANAAIHGSSDPSRMAGGASGFDGTFVGLHQLHERNFLLGVFRRRDHPIPDVRVFGAHPLSTSSDRALQQGPSATYRPRCLALAPGVGCTAGRCSSPAREVRCLTVAPHWAVCRGPGSYIPEFLRPGSTCRAALWLQPLSGWA